MHKAFGGNTALKDVSLLAEPGRITALIGPNGSGKTTLLNMVCGFYRMDEGQITLDGAALPVRKPAMVAQAGVARTFQTPNIPAGITVLEAVAAGRFSGNRVSTLSHRAATAEVPRRAPSAISKRPGGSWSSSGSPSTPTPRPPRCRWACGACSRLLARWSPSPAS